MVPLPRATRCGLRAPTASCFAQPPDQHHTGTQHGRACKGRLLGWHALGEHCESLAEPTATTWLPSAPQCLQAIPACPNSGMPSMGGLSRNTSWGSHTEQRPLSSHPKVFQARTRFHGHHFHGCVLQEISPQHSHPTALFSANRCSNTPGLRGLAGHHSCCSPELGWRHGCKVSLAFTTLQKGPTFPPWKSTSPCALNPKHSQHHLC